MTRLTLVRHGTTEWMEQGRLHGVSDSPLSERGRQEAQLAAARLAGQSFDAFYTSPLGRARQTAEIIGRAVGLEPIPLEGLHELNFGWLEGGYIFRRGESKGLRRLLRSAWVEWMVNLTGEPRLRFARRIRAAVDWIVAQHPQGRVLVVTHTAVHGLLLALLLDGNPAAWGRYDGWAPCGITEIEVAPSGKARLISLNEQDHLIPLRSEK